MNLGFLTLDYIILIVATILFLIAGLRFGKSVLVAFILSFYPTYLIYSNLSFLDGKGNTVSLVALALIYVVVYFAARHTIATAFAFSNTMKYIQALTLSASCTFILLFIDYKILPNALHNFSKAVDGTFSGIPMIAWIAVPIVALIISSRD